MKKILSLLFLFLLCGCAAKPQPPQYDKPVIALLDTGISTTAISGEHLLPGYNYVTETTDTEDRLNHGTAVASIIVGCESAGIDGIATGQCLLLPLVVADENSSIPPETLAQAIRDAVDVYGASILNISLGIKKDVDAVRNAVEYAEKKGVLVVSAVGNEGSGDLFYPAAYETVLAVGSHDRNGNVSNFSQRNGTTDLLAPGEDVWFASKDGRTYGSRGTSYATGYVTAAAVRLLAETPDMVPAELREYLYGTAVDVGIPGWDAESGWGILQMDKKDVEIE